MWKKIRIMALLVGLGLFFFSTAALVTIAPSEPANVVNHATRECAQIATGDECESCVPAAGWELLQGTCPEGYRVLERWAPSTCTFYASPYCCETRANPAAGCASPPSLTRSSLIGTVLIGITLIAGSLVIFYKKRVRRQ